MPAYYNVIASTEFDNIWKTATLKCTDNTTSRSLVLYGDGTEILRAVGTYAEVSCDVSSYQKLTLQTSASGNTWNGWLELS